MMRALPNLAISMSSGNKTRCTLVALFELFLVCGFLPDGVRTYLALLPMLPKDVVNTKADPPARSATRIGVLEMSLLERIENLGMSGHFMRHEIGRCHGRY